MKPEPFVNAQIYDSHPLFSPRLEKDSQIPRPPCFFLAMDGGLWYNDSN